MKIFCIALDKQKKYGNTCFERWGGKGGSPVLKAWKPGRIPKRLVKSKS